MDTTTRSARLIVADDHAVTRAGISRWLQDEPGFEVVAQASCGQEALALVERHHPDLLLSDIQMPTLGGVELARAVRERYDDVAVLLMTAYNGWHLQEIMAIGGVSYLTKEADRDLFVLAVRYALQGRCMIDPDELHRTLAIQHELDARGLTATERRILSLLHESNAAISARLGMKETTLRKTHLPNIYFKIGVGKRYDAIEWARARKLLTRQE